MEMMRERDGDDARVSNNRLRGERERERRREREGQRNEPPPFTLTKLKKIEREMEEIRKLAMIYYAKLSDDQKQWTRSLFRKIDTNGDEKVTVQEFFGYFITGGSDYLVKLFRFLDKNHTGTLDFEECVTFFYMIASNRLLECDGCGSLLLAAYFLCVECYNANREDTYNLCCSCYSDDNFSHEHSYFLDNYALLLQKEIKSNSAAECSSQKFEEPTGIFGLNSGVEYSYPRDPFLNYTPGQADSTRSTLNYTSGQAGISRSKIVNFVDKADAFTNYDDRAGFIGSMAGLAHSTLSKSGNTSQGSKCETLKYAAHGFLTGIRMLSILSHAPAAAHFLVPAIPATWTAAFPTAAHFAANAVPAGTHFAAPHAVPAAAYFFGCAIM